MEKKSSIIKPFGGTNVKLLNYINFLDFRQESKEEP